MSRRSARLAVKSVSNERKENIATELESGEPLMATPSKKRRPNLGKKTKHAAVKVNEIEEHSKNLEDKLPIKQEVGHEASHIKTEDQKSLNKITKEEKYVGAHVSISGGIHLSVERALAIGAKSFAMFLRSQRQWNAKPLSQSDADQFRTACEKHGFSPDSILPHGIYLMNCGSPDWETLSKSRQVLVEELQRCEMLGLTLYNFHPGSTCGKISVDKCLTLIAESINLAHQQTKYVIAVLENMSCQGNTVGGKFEELRGIIEKVHDKSRVGVCLDTCHAFAAGYDFRTKDGYERMMNDFENVVGLQYLKGVHLNDSKGELGCHLDRHENIGKGKIGSSGFEHLMNDPRLNGVPMVLETPCQSDDVYEKEINLLYSMQRCAAR
ncbi:uncharacterized protein LOC114526146 [Dendronephthya gigantea]|uniref:uncharacterized protein LOC114526146 n=1 Tax=Dendronephthya gigantea TaxID=151771 RepID=UPI00106D2043|nr:uncharacterized protein LOC114526146 [Dendronephthya gigantea]